MSKIVLWKTRLGAPSWAVQMLAELLGIQLQEIDINLLNSEHKTTEYKQMNPMGTVPMLKDGDFVISESHTIMKYLLEKYGKEEHNGLYPSGLEERALVDQALYFDTGVAFIRVKSIARPTFYGAATDIPFNVIQEVQSVYEVLDAYLSKHKYVASDHLTIADLSLGATVTSLNNCVPISAFGSTRVASWLAELHKKSYFKNIALPGAEYQINVFKSYWERNKEIIIN